VKNYEYPRPPIFKARTRERILREVRRRKCKVGVEIGVHRGEFSKKILERTDIETLYLIDPWVVGGIDYPKNDRDEDMRMALEAVEPHKDRVVIVRGFSMEVADQLPNLDFIYIDGDHRYEGVKGDMETYWPKCNDGGIFAGHDFYLRHKCGVPRACYEFFDSIGHEFYVTRCGYWPSWWTIK